MLEWRQGPHAEEVHRALLAQLAEYQSRLLNPHEITLRPDRSGSDPRHRLFLRVHGVAVELRSCSPTGVQQAINRRDADLRDAAHPAQTAAEQGQESGTGSGRRGVRSSR